MTKTFCLILTGAALLFAASARGALLGSGAAGEFPLVAERIAAPFLVETDCDRAVTRAADDLRSDIERVSGLRPAVQSRLDAGTPALVVVGVSGHSPVLDQIVATKKLDLSALSGAWESFVIAVVPQPLPGVREALVIAGSDRRGAIYGCYELSAAIGVSPWYWWADVPPEHRETLYVAAGHPHFGPPSVKYRGIFINDEDWGLQPWAAKTFEPEHRDIGPKTYAKVFELMLRLKANTVWPAMHACTKPFNTFPENKRIADEYGIVMGSSHAEPMLRNNVGEWTGPHEDYNYVTHRENVRAYWEQRVQENGGYENIYTLGMRGIHDSGMQGASSDAERIKILEQVFADQRGILTKYARPAPPQMFCAYKEVLGLYRGGLHVPDDVTIVWPDDNFGYIRNYATEEERRRSGGFGVYYHLSYLGAPLSYLWLSTTPPALVWEEMTKAYDHGARTIWIANVGDVKPAEIATEFFFQVAWDVTRWRRDNLPDFLLGWATREFGAAAAPDIAEVMREYYRLDYQRKPEHLQWWHDQEAPRASPFTSAETVTRLAAFDALREKVRRIKGALPAERQDAFFELVEYPVVGAALANERYFAGEQTALAASTHAADTEDWRRRALAADAALNTQTAWFNEHVAGGKWRGIVSLEPAGSDWSSMRIARWQLPTFSSPQPQPTAAHGGRVISIEAEHFDDKADRGGAAWQIVPGLGRTGEGSVAIFPTTAPSVAPADFATAAARLDYQVEFDAAGEFPVMVNLIPTQPIRNGRGLRFGLGIDDESPHEVVAGVEDGSAPWAQSVLNATVVATTKLSVKTPGPHTLHIFGEDAGVVLDKIVVDCGGLQPSYLGPEEWRGSPHGK